MDRYRWTVVRVLYVSRSHGVHDRRFVDAWAAAGAEVFTLATDDFGGGPSGAFVDGLVGTLDSVTPDLVQVGPVTWPGAVVAEVWNGPLIATSWAFDLMHDIDVDAEALAQATAVLLRADRLFVDNDAVARRALELGAPEDALIRFPWGIDQSVFTDASRPGEPARDPYRIVSVRRHEPLYRVADVLDAFALASVGEPRLRLVLAGSGSLTPALRTRAQKAGVADLVSWPGELHAAELAELLRSGGLYVSSSPVDGSSVSLLEAMASGIPVVVTDIEGNRQWVDDTTGWRYAVGDVVALAELMLRLTGGLDAEVEIRRKGAVRLVTEQANWAATAGRFLEFAREAIVAAAERQSGRPSRP